MRLLKEEEEKNDGIARKEHCFHYLGRTRNGLPCQLPSSKFSLDYPTQPLPPLPDCEKSTNSLVSCLPSRLTSHRQLLHQCSELSTGDADRASYELHVVLDDLSRPLVDQTARRVQSRLATPESHNPLLPSPSDEESHQDVHPPEEDATLGGGDLASTPSLATDHDEDNERVDCRVEIPFLVHQAYKISGHQSAHRFPRLARLRRRLRRTNNNNDEDDEEEEKRRRVRKDMRSLQRRYFWYPSTYVLRIENEHPDRSAVVLIRDLHDRRKTHEDNRKLEIAGGPEGGKIAAEAANKYIFETPLRQRLVVRPENHRHVNVNEGDVVLVTVCFKLSESDPFYYATDMNIQVNCDTQYYIIEEADLQKGVGSLKVNISIKGERVIVSNYEEHCAPGSNAMVDSSAGNTSVNSGTGPERAPDGSGNCDLL